MDKKELLKEYEELNIKGDIKSKIRMIDILYALGDDLKVEEFFDENLDFLLENEPILTIEKHVHYYIFKTRFDLARNTLNRYKNMNFISMEVEDFFIDLEELIDLLSKPKPVKQLDDETIFNDFTSGNADKISSCYQSLNKANVRQFLSVIQDIFLEDIQYQYKVLLLFTLLEQRVEKDFKVIKDDGSEFMFNAKDFILPFEKEKFLKTLKYINESNDSPSVIHLAKEIIKMTDVRRFPDSILDLYEDPLVIAEIVLYIANISLGSDLGLDDLSSRTGLDLLECDELLEKINLMIQ